MYIQVDDEILQGATVEITYKFYAQNNSEIDLIRDTLDVIRYNELVKRYGDKLVNSVIEKMIDSNILSEDEIDVIYRGEINE